ncbi:MAG: PIN domain-containing protein [Nitrospirae bacterium]|nr:PIN domain-containing protein [Nitrospirota bacterium]MCL5423432.1 PIN domain-containing protein [Nitrospirota bacterium]
MMTFIDTSAFYAVLDRDDDNHQKARRLWNDVFSDDNTIVTSNYVLVESFTLIQQRLGLEAVRAF